MRLPVPPDVQLLCEGRVPPSECWRSWLDSSSISGEFVDYLLLLVRRHFPLTKLLDSVSSPDWDAWVTYLGDVYKDES